MSNIRIRRMNRVSWKKWSRVIMRTMRANLPIEVCLTSADIRLIFSAYNHVAFLATMRDQFAGFSLGFFHTFDDFPEIADILDKNIFHLCLNIIDPAFQGKGLGQTLLALRIAEAKKRGARSCTSFAREGASLHNLHKAGGSVIGTRKNFQKSGETFHIIRLDIA